MFIFACTTVLCPLICISSQLTVVTAYVLMSIQFDNLLFNWNDIEIVSDTDFDENQAGFSTRTFRNQRKYKIKNHNQWAQNNNKV
jgi:hypothetical protein